MNKSAINKKLKSAYKIINTKNEAFANKANVKLVRLYKNALSDIRLELDKMYSRFGNEAPSLAQAARINQLHNIESNIKEILVQLHGDSATVIQDSMRNLYEYNYTALPKTLNKVMGINISLGSVNEAAVQKSIENPMKYLIRNTNLVNEKLRQSVTSNLIKGEAFPKLSNDIANIMGEGTGAAMRIARTEQHRVIAESRADSFADTQDTANSIGMTVEKVWISSTDARTRESHLAMNGQISISGKFDFNGQLVEEPGMTGDPGEDINCRCSTGVVLV